MLGHEESKEHSPVSGGILMFPMGLEVRTSVSLESVLYFVIFPKEGDEGIPKSERELGEGTRSSQSHPSMNAVQKPIWKPKAISLLKIEH